jgi:hypothetical protein
MSSCCVQQEFASTYSNVPSPLHRHLLQDWLSRHVSLVAVCLSFMVFLLVSIIDMFGLDSSRFSYRFGMVGVEARAKTLFRASCFGSGVRGDLLVLLIFPISLQEVDRRRMVRAWLGCLLYTFGVRVCVFTWPPNM